VTETDALRRPFRLGVLAVAITFLLLGGIIGAFGSGADRPEGVAERWLNAVGDTTRKGVADDARERAGKIGPLGLVETLVPEGTDTDGKTAFTELEVGRATTTRSGVASVPFQVHLRTVDGDAGNHRGTIVMRHDVDWRVLSLAATARDAKLPSEGGPPVSSAPLGLYAGAVVVGLAVTLAASALVRAATR
jgi:hypothetical protein